MGGGAKRAGRGEGNEGREKEKSELRYLIARFLYRDDSGRDEAFERHENLRLVDIFIRTPITLRHFSESSQTRLQNTEKNNLS